MREIKFRAWDKINGMVYNPAFQVLSAGQFEINRCFEQDYPKFMQYTGLKDKNGKEIYEGDILNTNTFRAKAVTPYIVEEALPFIKLVNAEGWAYDNGDYYEGGNIMSHEWKKFEVIGNIYENPAELMKTGNSDTDEYIPRSVDTMTEDERKLYLESMGF